LLDRLGRNELEADRKTRKRYTRADLKDHDVMMAGRIVDHLAMGSAPYVSCLAKEMAQRIVAGDRSMRRLKKTIIARIIT